MIPINAKYDNNKQSSYARSYSSSILPQQAGPYTDGSTINIHIPCTQNCVLSPSESFLKFNLQVTNSGTASAYMRLSAAGAHACIKRIRVWHGSNLLEDLDEYGLIVSKMMSFQQSGDSFAGKLNILAGTSDEYAVDIITSSGDGTTINGITVTNAAPTNVQLASVLNTLYNTNGFKIVAGERLWDDAATDQFAQIEASGYTLTHNYTINLFSILGSLSSKYLPVYAMSQSGIPIRLEIQLHDNGNKFINSEQTISAFSLSDVEFVASYVELGDQAMSVVQQHAGDQLKFVTTGWRNFGYTATRTNTTADQIQIAVPAKYASLKALFLTQREKASGAATYHANDSCDFGLSEYNVRLGSRVVPAKAPNTRPEMFCNVLQALGSLSDINHESVINLVDYDITKSIVNTETATYVNSTASEAQFMIGLDLESYSGASPTDVFQGYNSSTEDVHWVLKYDASVDLGANKSVKFDTFAMYDQVVVVQDGLMSVVY